MTVYDPTRHRTVVQANGEVSRKFYAVNKLLMDMALTGLIRLVVQDLEPPDQTAIWLDISDPEAANGVPKVYSGGWVTLTRHLFYVHIAGGEAGFVTDAEMASYVSGYVTGRVGVEVQAWSENLDAWSLVEPGDYLTISGAAAAYQPLDSDLTAISALSTTSFGRSMLELANAAAGRTAFGLGTMATETAANYTPTANLGAVALSNDYGDLDNKPSIPAAQINSDWNAVTGVAEILNKPTLGTAAAANTGDFATSAQGGLADTAVQPGDLGALATKNTVTAPTDISATGTPSATTYLRGDNTWAEPPGGGGGGGDTDEVDNLSDVPGDSVTEALNYLVTPTDPLPTQLPTLIPVWDGTFTAYGDMTASDGLAGIFDRVLTTEGRRNATTGWFGIDLKESTHLLSVEVTPSLSGFDWTNAAGNVTISLYGHSSPPSSGNSGTLVYTTGSFADTSEFRPIQLPGGSTAYRYWTVYIQSTSQCACAQARFHRVPAVVALDSFTSTLSRSVSAEMSLPQTPWDLHPFRTRFEITAAGSINVNARLEAQHVGHLLAVTQYTDVVGVGARLYYRYAAALEDLDAADWVTFPEAVSGCNIASLTDHYGGANPSFCLNAAPGFYEIRLDASGHTSGDTRQGIVRTKYGTNAAYNELRIVYARGGAVVKS